MHLNSSGLGGYLGTAFINHLCYADDLCLISLSSSGMQQLLHICNTYAAEHQLLYNGSKSFSLCFKRKELKVSSPSFFLGKSKIPMVEQCRYLGTTISTKNSDFSAPMWFDCTKTALKKLKVAYNNSLRRFMGLPWHNSASEMFVNLNIKSFGEMLRSFVYSFRSRIMISGNLMLIGIYHSPCIIYSNLWAWWRTLLFVNL